MTDGIREGWGFPGGSRKAHYFVGTMSLCRRWGFFQGPLTPNQGGTSPDDCAVDGPERERPADRAGDGA